MGNWCNAVFAVPDIQVNAVAFLVAELSHIKMLIAPELDGEPAARGAF